MPIPSRDALEAVAREAGALALRHFRRAAAERKPDRTLVTRADREVESLLVARLSALLPEAGIIGEEGAARPTAGPYRFALDPIDGTAAFVAGLPTWCVCLGLLHADVPIAGVVHLPCAGETYTAVEERAWWNGVPLPSLGETPPDGDPFLLVHAKTHRRYRLAYGGKVRSLGSTAYHVALVARGVAEAALLGRVHLWDVVAPGAVLAAVGGTLEYVSGGRVGLTALLDGRRAEDAILAGRPGAIASLRPQLVDLGA